MLTIALILLGLMRGPAPPAVLGPRSTADPTPTYRFVAHGVSKPRFECGFDGHRIRRCRSRVTRRLTVGKHVLRVRTLDRRGRRSRVTTVRIAILEPAGPRVERIAVGGHPVSLLEANGSIWVANYINGVVQRIDPATNRVVATVGVGGQPWGLAAESGSIWVGNNGRDDVARIDPATNRVTLRVHAGDRPIGITSGDGLVWVVNFGDGGITRIDASSGAVTGRAVVSGEHEDAAVGLGALWVPNEEGTVSRVDPISLVETATIKVGLDPDFVLVADGSVWTSAYRDRIISRVDPQQDAVTATIPVVPGMQGIVLDGGTFWAANYDEGALYRLDATGRVLFRHTVGAGPRDVLLADGSVWVANSRSSTVTRMTLGP